MDWKKYIIVFRKRSLVLNLLVITITVLAQLDGIIALSNILSNLLEYWRNILHWLFETPLNFFLQLINFRPIDIPSPIPESCTIFGLFLLSGRKSYLISTMPLSNVVNYIRQTPHAFLPNDHENNFGVWLLGKLLDSIMNLIAIIPALIITSILFQSFVPSIVLLGSLAILQVSLDGRPADWLEDALEAYGFYLCFAILVFSTTIIIFSSILELIVPWIKMAVG